MQLFKYLDPIDQRVFDRLKSFQFGEGVRTFLKIYTRLGDGFIWVAAIAYLVYKMSWSGFIDGLPIPIVSVVFSIALYWAVKLSVRRPRPFQVMKDVRAEVPPLDKFSFPSGHTMNNLGVGLVIGVQHPELMVFTVGLPISWGFLRIYFGVHYFTDIMAGILLGTLCGWGAFAVFPYLEPYFW